ncbi:ankyrin repeat domain-containing protein [Wolbachia endosymbiont (group B) of Camptogramma bilineatum]|uniref:ankyrin repeat domain-containing protein n=1 Tax=Wolbachia endosymbiont (group B) of Camptogramma bilineatum TaxID=2953991 RepID=UPI0022328693|nr:ankyrin repeat domain-containing protein [Wolbachia endosymbiont (group B) of Camptogramma bilineatum]
MEYEQWLGILTSINADNDLNESNIIKKIGEKLEKENPDTYQEWQDNQCGVNYTLSDSQLTLLHIAAANGLAKVTELLIKKEADVNKANQYGWAPLHCAAADGRTEIVKALIEKGAIVNAAGEDKWTPLHHAAVEGHTEIVKTLIEKGADVNTVGEDNYTPLYLAVKNGHTEVIKALIEKGADVNAVDKCALLRFAAKIGRTEMVKALIEKGVNVNAVDIMGYTSLHFAAKNGHTEVVKALIEKGAIVEVVDINGHRYTPLHFAAQMGHTEIVNVLIENVANVNVLSESDKVTPLYLAVQNGHAETVKALMKKGANPLLENKSYRTLKRLTELIKNNHLPKKAEKTTTGEQVDDEYELLKYSLLFRNGCPLIDNVRRDTFDNLLCTWFADVSGLTQEQKELNKKLLSILKDLSYLSDRDENILRNFLRENKDDDDLEYILNLPRGESGLTILHVISSMDGKLAEKYVNLLLEAGADPNKKDDRGKTPLHYASCNNIGSLIKAGADPNVQDSEKRTPLHCAAGIGDEKSVNIFLEHGADSSKKDKQEKTPLQVATDNHNYHVEMHFLTDNQKRLCTELGRIVDAEDFFTDFTELKRFLSKYKSTQDLKRILNLRDYQGKSEILLNLRIVFYSRHFRDCEAPYEEAKRLLLEAEAIDYERLDRKEHSPESGTLWDNLILNQQQKLKMFLGEVGAAQDMKKLGQVVNKAIESGVRFNFLIHPGKMMYQDTYNFTDCVMKKISALKKSSKVENDIEVASGIVCKLVSKGAMLHNLSSIDVIDTLESEFKDHKTNIKKAHEEYVNNTLEFMEIVKSATNGKVKNAKIDNSTFYLEYSENSKIDVAKITDGARDLGLTQGEIEYGRDIIKIGKSEVEIITQKGIRNYTDLTEGSSIALTFYTSLGELEVRLYPDENNKKLIRVEVSDEDLFEEIASHEEIGQNCLLGGLPVIEAIDRGVFARSGGLMRPEVISESNKNKDSWVGREELRRASNSRGKIASLP